MQLRRNEILTGILVLATVGILTGILILLGAPGLFKPLVTYKIYMDNAAGIKLGAPVLLAGRKIGQVERCTRPCRRKTPRVRTPRRTRSSKPPLLRRPRTALRSRSMKRGSTYASTRRPPCIATPARAW